MILKKGSKGAVVLELQQLLQKKGFYSGALDGDFGPKTYAAVLQFQMANDLKADGAVGPRTWTALRSTVALPPSATLASTRDWLLGLIPETLAADKPRVDRTLRVAVGDLGRKEIPDGSNNGPELEIIQFNPVRPATRETYMKYCRWANQSDFPPWCALAVSSWIARGIRATHWKDEQAPPGTEYPTVSHIFPRWFGGVAQMEEWAKKEGTFDSVPSVGAIFTMGRGNSGSDPATSITNGHTGLVIALDGDRIYTIEGNTGNRVDWKHRKRSDIRGYIRWS